MPLTHLFGAARGNWAEPTLFGNPVLPAQSNLPRPCPFTCDLDGPAPGGIFGTREKTVGLSACFFQQRPVRLPHKHLTFRRYHPVFRPFQNPPANRALAVGLLRTCIFGPSEFLGHEQRQLIGKLPHLVLNLLCHRNAGRHVRLRSCLNKDVNYGTNS